MVVIVSGDREYRDYDKILGALAGAKEFAKEGLVVVHGGQRKKDKNTGDWIGADELADQACKQLSLITHRYPAQWNAGNFAGPKRNTQMLDLYPDAVVFAFHDYLQNSKGTRDTVTKAIERGHRVILYRDDEIIELEQLDWLDND